MSTIKKRVSIRVTKLSASGKSESNPELLRTCKSPQWSRHGSPLMSPRLSSVFGSPHHCKLCRKKTDTLITHKETDYHLGCHPCTVCDRPVPERRCIRIYVGSGDTHEMFSDAPWGCICLNRLDGGLRQARTSDTIEAKLLDGDIIGPEFPAFLANSIPFIDHQYILDKLISYSMLVANYDQKQMAALRKAKAYFEHDLHNSGIILKKGGGYLSYMKE